MFPPPVQALDSLQVIQLRCLIFGHFFRRSETKPQIITLWLWGTAIRFTIISWNVTIRKSRNRLHDTHILYFRN